MDIDIRLARPDELRWIDGWSDYEVTVPATRDLGLAERHLRTWRRSAPARGTPPGMRRLDIVAAEGSSLLGFTTLLLGGRDALTGEALGYIADVQVDPGSRRQGIGRRLVEGAIALARREGMALVTLDVAEGNRKARRLYASLGFQPESRRLGLRLDGRPGGGGTVRL
ncbi:MAG TPA: GNAT family N-acetyltransferase [Bacillota bacterium]|nr:GNAT family N-acetyltransferase [Bacillota bacterium]